MSLSIAVCYFEKILHIISAVHENHYSPSQKTQIETSLIIAGYMIISLMSIN